MACNTHYCACGYVWASNYVSDTCPRCGKEDDGYPDFDEDPEPTPREVEDIREAAVITEERD